MGRKPRLSAAQVVQIGESLKRGAESLGYKGNSWTSLRVRDLIEREYGINYHPGHVWKILRRLGWRKQPDAGGTAAGQVKPIGR